MSDSHPIFVTTSRGFENHLAQELAELGAQAIQATPSGVACQGALETAYRICLWSRIASRVLWFVKDFPATTPDELYNGIRSTNWSKHLDLDGSLAVTFTSRRSQIKHSKFGAQKVKDAIVDQFFAREGRRPNVELEQPDVRVSVHVEKDHARVAIDLSGDSLHRRGYREDTVKAPLKESLAAALLIHAGWSEIVEKGGAFIDPFCGSGTLPIEAAMIAGHIAPGLLRDYWGFDHWLLHDQSAWQALIADAEKQRDQGLVNLPLIQGYDIDRWAVRSAIANVEKAGLAGKVHIEKRDFRDVEPAAKCQSGGLVLTNPPYGERLGDGEVIQRQYADLGHALKENFTGWRAAILAVDREHGFALGIRSAKPLKFFNGPLECMLMLCDISEDQFFTPRGEEGGLEHTLKRKASRLLKAGLPDSAAMLCNRLRKNLKHLGRWARKSAISAYRLYDADLPEYAFALDVYESDQTYLVMQEYQAPASIEESKAEARLVEAMAVVMEVMASSPDVLFLKKRQKQKGTSQYSRQDRQQQYHEIQEGHAKLLVNFQDYLDTGLFLDHRITRQKVAQLVKNKRFLNLFCYTGSVTVHAALEGASSSVSVDLSRTYIEWARNNFRLNRIDEKKHLLVEDDCLVWLEHQARVKPESFDVIFLDPPTFSNSKSMKETFDVQEKHGDLLSWCLRLLSKEGILVFSNNFRRFRLDESVLEGTSWEEITKETLPEDFRRRGNIHRCWLIKKTA